MEEIATGFILSENKLVVTHFFGEYPGRNLSNGENFSLYRQ